MEWLGKKPLDAPERHCLQAASGWLDLGNYVEAHEEMQRIRSEFQLHVDVLKMRWEVYAMAHQWNSALTVALFLRVSHPEDSFGWLHQAKALHAMNRTCEAWGYLVPAAELFPENAQIPYELARYATVLGYLSEARTRLSNALTLDASQRLTALDDPDLEPLWRNLGTL